MGYIEEATAKKELAALEQERQRLEKELATTRTSRQDWKDKAQLAQDEVQKTKAAYDELIDEIKKKYHKVKGHVLKNFRGALGELDFLDICASPRASLSWSYLLILTCWLQTSWE